jgi:hypothetical protein
MRVPAPFREWVVELIGQDRSAMCTSIGGSRNER